MSSKKQNHKQNGSNSAKKPQTASTASVPSKQSQGKAAANVVINPAAASVQPGSGKKRKADEAKLSAPAGLPAAPTAGKRARLESGKPQTKPASPPADEDSMMDEGDDLQDEGDLADLNGVALEDEGDDAAMDESDTVERKSATAFKAKSKLKTAGSTSASASSSSSSSSSSNSSNSAGSNDPASLDSADEKLLSELAVAPDPLEGTELSEAISNCF